MEDTSKVSGTTKAERYLAKLCRKSFLSLWSYFNPFTDRGRSNDKGVGKELCDVLIVFDNNIIIFSDKSEVAFPDSGNLIQDWSRWFNKALIGSAKQIYGAERWIKNYSSRIYHDSKCQQQLIFDILPIDQCNFYRIAVATDGSERCRRELGGSGSMMIQPNIAGKVAHLEGQPFVIGNIDTEKGFIHILDEVGLDSLLRELDTISDFVGYLQKKEKFLLSDKLIFISGEEELLAFYLQDIDEQGEHNFIIPNEAKIVYVKEGLWLNLSQHEQYITKKKADKISYLWDDMIEELIRQTLDVSQYEKIFRILAAESRLSRRALGLAISSLFELGKSTGKSRVRLHVSMKVCDPLYVFAYFPKPNNINQEQYFHALENMLTKYCYVAKSKHPKFINIIAIELTSGKTMLLSASTWTQEQENEAKRIQSESKILLDENINFSKFSINEYSEANISKGDIPD